MWPESESLSSSPIALLLLREKKPKRPAFPAALAVPGGGGRRGKALVAGSVVARGAAGADCGVRAKAGGAMSMPARLDHRRKSAALIAALPAVVSASSALSTESRNDSVVMGPSLSANCVADRDGDTAGSAPVLPFGVSSLFVADSGGGVLVDARGVEAAFALCPSAATCWSNRAGGSGLSQ